METTFTELVKEIQDINNIETKEIPIKIIKFNEEFGEFAAEFLKMRGYTYKEYSEKDLKSEMADSLQCLLSIFLEVCEEANIPFTDILTEMKVKNKKWRDKITEYLNNKDME